MMIAATDLGIGTGHSSVGDQDKARALRLTNAEKGFRQPVQVMDGNYNRMPGVCPWWDQMKAQAVG